MNTWITSTVQKMGIGGVSETSVILNGPAADDARDRQRYEVEWLL